MRRRRHHANPKSPDPSPAHATRCSSGETPRQDSHAIHHDRSWQGAMAFFDVAKPAASVVPSRPATVPPPTARAGRRGPSAAPACPGRRDRRTGICRPRSKGDFVPLRRHDRIGRMVEAPPPPRPRPRDLHRQRRALRPLRHDTHPDPKTRLIAASPRFSNRLLADPCSWRVGHRSDRRWLPRDPADTPDVMITLSTSARMSVHRRMRPA